VGVVSRWCGRKTSFFKTEVRFGGFGNGLAQPAADVPRVLVLGRARGAEPLVVERFIEADAVSMYRAGQAAVAVDHGRLVVLAAAHLGKQAARRPVNQG